MSLSYFSIKMRKNELNIYSAITSGINSGKWLTSYRVETFFQIIALSWKFAENIVFTQTFSNNKIIIILFSELFIFGDTRNSTPKTRFFKLCILTEGFSLKKIINCEFGAV